VHRPDAAAASVVGVFQAQQATGRRGVIGALGLKGCGQLIGGKQAAMTDADQLDGRQGGAGPGFVPLDVRAVGTQDIVTGLNMAANRDLIGHGSRWNKQRSGLAQAGRHHFFKSPDGRIFAEHVVANIRRCNRRSHRCRRSCHCIGAQVDDGLHDAASILKNSATS
jgi:hypothetical protein